MNQELFNPREVKPRFFIKFNLETGRAKNLGREFRQAVTPNLLQIR